MDAYTTNSSYWRSSGNALQQWVMYSYNTHTATHLKCGFKFRTTSVLNDRILFSKDGTTTREWLFLQSDQKLQFGLFKTNAISQLIPLTDAGYHNDGKWHEVEVEWNSNGAGLGGVLTATIDGVTTNYDTPNIDSIQFGSQNITLNGRDAGYGPIVFDCEYVMINDRRWNFSSLYSTIVYSNDGEKYFQSIGQNLSSVWKNDTESHVYPNNFINGGYRYTNGTSSQDVILSKVLPKYFYNSGGSVNDLSTSETSSWNVTVKSEYFGVSKNMDFRFMVNNTSPVNNYRLYISQLSNGHGTISMSRYDNNVETMIKEPVTYLFTMENDISIDVTRSAGGLFTIFVNGVELFNVTDTTYTTAVASQIYNQRHYIVSASAGDTPFSLNSYTLTYLGLPDYTSYEVLPPSSFNNSEVKFYLPYNQLVDNSDTESKLYNLSDESIDIGFDVLDSGGFGDYIKYRDNGDNSFSRFIVKKKP